MADPRSKGRMLRKDLSNSKKLAALSPKAYALFMSLIPHYDSHGKMNGDPMYVKSEIVPLVPWMTVPYIRKALAEIDKHTNVKWFQSGGRWYLHALNWREHQDLREDRLGADSLPSHPSVKVPDKSGSSPGVVPPEVEVEGEVEGKVEEEVELGSGSGNGGGGLKAPPPTAPSPNNRRPSPVRRAIPDNVLAKATPSDTGKPNWRNSVPHLQAEVEAGRLTQIQARTGLLMLGAREGELAELFPDIVARPDAHTDLKVARLPGADEDRT